MNVKDQIEQWLDRVLQENPALFLIDLKIDHDQVKIILDGDRGVTLKDCVTVSRKIERAMEEEGMDLSLEVSSAGVAAPLKLARQYKKNLGRKLEVSTAGNRVEGTLTSATDDAITLEWKSREPKPIGKGKITVQKQMEIAISDIEEAKVKVTF